MAYADYEFYTSTYYGNVIAEEDFPRLAARASDYVYAYTQGISDKANGRDLEAVQKATCAVAEAMLDEEIMQASAFSGGQAVSSESVGSWSRSYAKGGVDNTSIEYIEKRKRDALLLYLGNLAAFAPAFRVASYRCVPGGCC